MTALQLTFIVEPALSLYLSFSLYFMSQHNIDRILYPELQMFHRNAIQCRFGDYDAFRHVNNNAILAYFDIGKTEFFRDLTGHSLTPDQLGAVIVNINIDFLAPVKVGVQVEVLTAVVNVGQRSFTLYQRLVDTHDRSIKAQATTTLAGFDISTQTASDLSPALLAALEPCVSHRQV